MTNLTNNQSINQLKGQCPKESTMTNLINELVYLITGVSNPTDNIVKGSVDQLEEFGTNMAADSFEMGRIDQAAVISQYHWYWDRGLELENLDKEEAIANMRENLIAQRKQHNQRMGNYIPSKGCYWKDTKACKANKKRLDHMLFEIKQTIETLDASFIPYEDESDRTERYSASEANLNYISDSVAKWDLGTCAMALDQIDALKATKQMTRKDHTMAKGLLLRKLANNAPTHYEVPKVSRMGHTYILYVSTQWHEDLQSCIEIFRDSDIKAPGYDDRFFGTVKFDIEAVIDLRAANPHLSMDDAIYCVKAAEEARQSPESFIPNMGL